MSSFREKAWRKDGRTYVRTHERTRLLRSQRPVGRETNKPSRGVSRLLTVFMTKELSKYRLKNPKKPEKTTKSILSNPAVFLGKIREKNFDTKIVLGDFLVQVVCWNTNGICLKSVSKTPTFRFFRDFQLFQHPAKIQNPAKWPILDSFWPKWAKQDFFQKKCLEHLFRLSEF